MEILQPRLGIGVGVAGQRFDQCRAVHSDAPVNPPVLDVDARFVESAVPRVHVQIVRIDQRAVDVEQHRRCFVARHLRGCCCGGVCGCIGCCGCCCEVCGCIGCCCEVCGCICCGEVCGCIC